VRSGDILEFYDFSSGEIIARRQVVALTEATDQNPTVGVMLVRTPLDFRC